MKKTLQPLNIVLLAAVFVGFSIGTANAQLTNIIRINSGGTAQNYGGEAWVADQYFTGGTAYSTTSAISNTTQDQIYQSERYGNVTYAIPVPSTGTYAVDLYFAEIYFTTTGQRVFNINVENGQFVRNNLDLIQTIGSINQAYVLRADNLNITDGTINITFTGVVDNAKISGIAVSRYADTNPVVINSIPDHTAIVGDLFTYNVPANTFSDPNGDVLTYTASLSNGNPLPSWLSFNATTRNFSGTAATGDIGTINVQVTASDNQSGSVNDVFQLTVATGFYRAININGAALTVDGNSWEASTGAPNFNFSQTNGGTFSNQSITLNPSTDASRATMIRSSVYGSTVNVNVTSVPNGIYDISIYVWEDDVPQTYSLSIEGTVAQSGYNSGSPGTWAKLGPFRRTITDGAINISTTGGHANLSGIEIRRGSTGEVLVSQVNVSPTAVTLAVGQAVKLEKTITPANATNLNVTWSSSNLSVATVDATGFVRAIAQGSATITATSIEGGHVGTSSITVQSVGSNVLVNPEFDLGMNSWIVGDWTGTPANTLQVVQGADLSGANALHVNVNNNNNVSWMLQVKTGLSFRLEVGRTYRVSFLAKGETSRQMGTALHGEGSNSDYWSANQSLTTTVQRFSYVYTPTSGQTGLASEPSFSIVFYLAKGTVSDVWLDNVRVEDITGINAVTNLALSPASLSLNVSQAGQLTKTFTPSNATNEDVTWSSSNSAVATVDSNGLVTAVAQGSATISAYTTNGGFTATSTINVTGIVVTGVSVSPTTLNLQPSQTAQLTKTIVPANATNQNVSWASSNANIATVDNNGLVTAFATGSTTITVTTVNGGFTAQVNVTVASSQGQISDAIEIAALKDLYYATGGATWTNKNNWPTTEQAWQSIQVVNDINFYGVGITDGDVTELTLAFNGLNGPIPQSIANLGKLEGVNFSNSHILSIGSLNQIGSLKYVYLRQAQLNILPDFGSCVQLTNLDLASNPAISSAPFPSWIQNLDDLELLDLQGSNISGPIPSWLGDLASLQYLYLRSNELSGAIPQNLSDVSGIDLSFNNLAGELPSWIFAEGKVVVMLNNNGLTGSLPEISSNTTLVYVNISNNSLTGSIPASINNLSNVSHLNLKSNQLTGSVPASLANLGPACTTNCGAFIDISQNKLSSIPSEFWDQLDYPLTILIDQNELVDIGTIPSTLNFPGLVSITKNFLTYNDLQSAFNYPTDKISYVVQRVTPDQINATIGQPLVISFEQPNASVDVLWEKEAQDITNLDESSSVNEFRRNTTTPQDAGAYYYRITNSQNNSIVLYVGPVNVNVNEPPRTIVLNDYAFQYKYDGRKRMTHKKVPGADWVYMVYDNRDRLVMTQDGEQRKRNDWTFTKYDELNRPVLTGIYTDTTPRDQNDMQQAINNFYLAADDEENSDEWFEVRDGEVHGYTNLSFPKVDIESNYLTVTYYDDYLFQPEIGSTADDFDYDPNQLTASGDEPGQRPEEFLRVQGQVTGSKVKNLDTNEFLWSVNYYDDRYRVIQVVAQNNKGGLDKITNVYDFIGKVLRTQTDHATTGPNAQAIATTRTFKYDHAGRLLQTDHNTGTDDPTRVVLVKNNYNELGQLVAKNLHSENDEPFRQQVDYRYNIRGWLTRINDSNLSTVDGGPKDYFGMELGYNDGLGLASDGQYNGNISAIKWSTSLGLGFNDVALEIFEPTARGYAFTYDPMNRLKSASHYENTIEWAAASSYHENISSYDLNGNIKNLNRTGKGGSTMDVLDYDSYQGNQLLKVIDNGDDNEGFKDGNTTGDDYIYDDNGNMITDKNKDINAIEYNHLNLPATVTKADGQYIKYIYNAAGVKLSQLVYDASNVEKKRTDYIGEFFYENDTLKFINHEEGRIVMTGEEPEYQYTLKDHLGNSRITFTTKFEAEDFHATLDTQNQSQEQSQFGAYNSFTNQTLDPTPSINENDKILILNGGYAGRIGLTKTFSVVPGDIIYADVRAKYSTEEGQGTDLGNIAVALTEAFSVTPGLPGETGTAFQALTGIGEWIASGGKEDDDDDPKGFITIIVFDKEYNLVDISFEQTAAGNVTLSAEVHIRQPGYAYIFVSNEGAIERQIGFDDYAITIEHSPVLQQDDYYPFGLTFNSYQRENSLEQKYLYNGKELQNELDLQLYDYVTRKYDPALGRFLSIDPASDNYQSWTPYHYVMNNPIKFVDPTGMFTELYNENGEKIGEDEAGNDGKVSIITNKDEAKRIKKEYKGGATATAEDVSKGIRTTKTVLGEALNVLERAEDNGGLREESSVVTGSGEIIRGETGPEPKVETVMDVAVQTAPSTVPSLPDGQKSTEATSIHSHPIKVQEKDGNYFPQAATYRSDQDQSTFIKYGTNIVVGNLSKPSISRNQSGQITVSKPVTGAAIYIGNGATPRVTLTKSAMQKIIK